MIPWFVVALSFVSSLQAPAPAKPSTLVRVYVFTDETRADAVADARDREDSVKDLRDAFREKKKDLVLVDAPSQADLVVEVRDRLTETPKFIIGTRTSGGQLGGAGTPTGPMTIARLRVTLSRSGEPVTFTNKNSPSTQSGGAWKSAAEDLAKQMEKWMADHRTDGF